MKRIYYLLAMLLLALPMVAQQKEDKKPKTTYECPMKCEPASDKPGKCGKCGMDLKKNKAGKASYECPMKCEPATDKAGKCGKCGMELKKTKA